MTWLALSDHTDCRLSLRGLGADKRAKPALKDDPNTLLMRGTLMFETRYAFDADPQVLISHKSTDHGLRSLTFQTTASGSIAMVQVRDGKIVHAALPVQRAADTDVVRVTYSWDAAAGAGRITLERPGETALTSVNVANPQPLSLNDLRVLMLGQGDHTFAPDIVFAALSDQIEPVGPMSSLLPNTPVATPWGYKTVSNLQRGDTVMTVGAGVVPILHRLSRKVPARGSFAPIRLRAPYFNLHQDIIVTGDQRVLVDGPEVEFLFGENAVLVPARHLVNGFSAVKETAGTILRYTQLLLPAHETILAAGTALESLYIGQIHRDKTVLQASMLHHLDQATLPDHPAPTHQVLNWSEAVHLACQRAA